MTTLYRPVGQKELDLIESSGWWRFPPRLDWQPIFYPVLTEDYATRIARDWNTKDEANGGVGYVLRFEVDDDYIAGHEVHEAGSRALREYWIPALLTLVWVGDRWDPCGCWAEGVVGRVRVTRTGWDQSSRC